ncbi:pyridine nucleotide-disulfide oxidoreductase family protein [Aspergillus tamarii]|uniref:Pyridine nucleotide-disulfide oxidoreductase family protein n=1 Tax=Aspergillus tamarii TaxID=41984 RepID=A0A5N6VD58_ASPTM|nr:pyridine nucleotide-disulfide oxidoreductase family protein [Aspergillus tamarii]
MTRIIIIGTGFSGVWSAFSAKRIINLSQKKNDIEVLVISPEPTLVIRPRLYEANAASFTRDLGPMFEEAGIKFFQGIVKTIDPDVHTVFVQSASGLESSFDYDRLILAAGSSVVRPRSITGIEQHAFDIDSLKSAVELEAHIENLASLPPSPARNTFVVCGGGFTGLEIVTELPKRLAHIPNHRIILIDNSKDVGQALGRGPRPVIAQALEDLGIEVKLGSSVAAIDADSIVLASGERIASKTAIWTAGVRATPLTQQIPGRKDGLGRLQVDEHLRVPSSRDIFATGDAAAALSDTLGHYTMMSCQHAIPLGRVSGYNAAADLLDEHLIAYTQPAYVCCLDLGSSGAVVTEGWDRDVNMTGGLAKRVKGYINRDVIYPPIDSRKALEEAVPVELNGNQLIEHILSAVA